MRCPGCKFVCSDLRDLCPKCLLDLRPAKKVMHLPIANPDIAYEALLHRTIKKSPKPQSKREKKSKVGGFFKTLVSKPVKAKTEAPPKEKQKVSKEVEVAAVDANVSDAAEHTEESTSKSSEEHPPEQTQELPASDTVGDIPDELTEHKETPSSTEQQIPSTPTPEVIDLTAQDSNMSDILDQMIDDTEFSVEAVIEETPEEEHEFEFTIELENEDIVEEGEHDTQDQADDKTVADNNLNLKSTDVLTRQVWE